MQGIINSYESGYFFTWFIDACHSGSARDEAKKWIEKMGGNLEQMQNGNTYISREFKYLDRDATF